MKIQTAWSTKAISALPSQGFAVLLPENFTATDYMSLSKIVDVDIAVYLELKKFTGAAGSCLTLPVVHDKKTTKLFFVGLGKKEKDSLNIETYRRALGTLITTAQAKKIATRNASWISS